MGDWMNSTQTTKPVMLNAVKPLFNNIMRDANRAYGNGPYFYNKNTVAPFAESSRNAFDGMRALAGANSGGAGMSGPLQSIMTNGGFTDGQMETLGGMRDLTKNPGLLEIVNGNGLTAPQNRALDATERAAGRVSDYADAITDNGGLSDDQQAAMSRWRTQISTPFSIDNPGYRTVRENALNDQKDALTARAVAMGRYGSGADQAILAREQGRLGGALDNAEYIRQENQDDAAASNMFQGGQTANTNIPMLQGAAQDAQGRTANLAQMGVTNRNTGLGLLSNLQSTLFNAENAGLDNMGRAYDTAMQPFYTQRAVGQEYETKRKELIADKLRRFDAQNPLSQIGQYLGLATGVPSGSSSTTTPSWLQTGLGLGLGGYGLLSLMNRPSFPAAPGSQPGLGSMIY